MAERASVGVMPRPVGMTKVTAGDVGGCEPGVVVVVVDVIEAEVLAVAVVDVAVVVDVAAWGDDAVDPSKSRVPRRGRDAVTLEGACDVIAGLVVAPVAGPIKPARKAEVAAALTASGSGSCG